MEAAAKLSSLSLVKERKVEAKQEASSAWMKQRVISICWGLHNDSWGNLFNFGFSMPPPPPPPYM